MLNLLTMPLKLECRRCKKLYLYQAKPAYPNMRCPICDRTTMLHGLAETADVLRHPLRFVLSYLKPSWHKRDKAH